MCAIPEGFSNRGIVLPHGESVYVRTRSCVAGNGAVREMGVECVESAYEGSVK